MLSYRFNNLEELHQQLCLMKCPSDEELFYHKKSYKEFILMLSKINTINDLLKTIGPWLEQGYFPNQDVFCKLIEMLGQFNQVDYAYKLFLLANQNNFSDIKIYNTILKAAGNTKNAALAEAIFEEAKKSNLANIFTYIYMIDAAGNANNIELAKKIFEAARRALLVNGITYNSMIYAAYKSDNLELAEAIFEEAKRVHLANVVSYNLMIHVANKAHNLMLATKIFEEIKVSGLTNENTYSSMIYAAYNADDIVFARQLFAEAKMVCLVDANVYNSIIYAEGNIGNLKSAEEASQEAKALGLTNVISCGSMINLTSGSVQPTIEPTAIHYLPENLESSLIFQKIDSLSLGEMPDNQVKPKLWDKYGRKVLLKLKVINSIKKLDIAKPLVPSSYPVPPSLEHPWGIEANLHYSVDWLDKGTYKLHRLTAAHLDFKFVEATYNLSPLPGYKIAEVVLLSDEGDEQAFIAGLDLLQKKHGNPVHQAKWKPKNNKSEPQSEEEIVQRKLIMDQFAQRQIIRKQLKFQRYRCADVPNVKLLAMWQGTSIDLINKLGETGFVDLTRTCEHLGKGYYGVDNASQAFTQAQLQYQERTVLILSWYAGKVVYPAIATDKEKLQSQPHYANHDLHFARVRDAHEAVVFDASQVLPRYIVTLKRIVQPSSSLMDNLLQNIPYHNPGQRKLLFQPNLSHSIAVLRDQSQEEIKKLPFLQKAIQSKLPVDTKATIDSLLQNFLQNTTKEILLLTTNSAYEKIISSYYMESFLWSYYQEGNPIPLCISLAKIPDLHDDLVRQNLSMKGLPDEAIADLKEYQQFTLILTGYDEIKNKIPLLKNNHFNRPGGFKAKIIVTCNQDFLQDSDDFLFYTEGGDLERQANRFSKFHITMSEKERLRQIAFIKEQNLSLKKLPQEQSSLMVPGGALKPWEYNNALRYSPEWIDKGTYRLHQVKPYTPDYIFLEQLYQQTAMPGYEIDEAYIVSDFAAEQAFTANLAILERRSNNSEYNPKWQTEEHSFLRQQVIHKFEQKSYKTLLAHSVKLLPLWHGTGPAAASGIATSGFASLALVDSGYFGKGLYGSSSAEYSYRVYARGYNQENGLLLLSWYSAQNVYPVVKADTHNGIEEDMDKDKLFGKANYQNYDSHFVPVVPYDPNNPEETVYYPAGENETPTYEEFVTFQTAQVLPRYILSLRDSVTKQRLPGMEKFLATSKVESPHRQALYQKGLTWSIATLKNSAKEEREQDFILSQGLSLYIPSQATNSEKVDVVPEETYLLYDKVEEFLASPTKEVWLLQGNSGSGKSLFGRNLERYLWDNYQEGDLIPLFIPLPRIYDAGNDLIKRALELKGLSIAATTELKAKKQFLFILDGYDEIPGKPQLIQKYNFNEPHNWGGKIIISSRSQHLSSDEDRLLYPHHPGQTIFQSAALFDKSFILPFNESQIEQYIKAYCKSQFNKINWSPEIYQQHLTEFKEVTVFLKEPFLLFLVLSALPDLKKTCKAIKKVDLYDAFISSWFKNQFERIIQHNFDVTKYKNPKVDILILFESYAKNLAFEMFLQETQAIRRNNDPTFNKFFEGEDSQLAFQGSPLKRIGETYLFIHKSFQEYFVAKKILDELELITYQSLQQKSLATSLAILNFTAERLQNNEQLKELLFTIILNSRDDKTEAAVTAAANAATMLNTARVVFSNRDLRGVNISGANLTEAILDNTNLEGATLTNACLKGAWLRKTNLDNCDLIGVSFLELAYQKENGKKIKSCAYSSNGNYFAAAINNKITIYHVESITNHLTVCQLIDNLPKNILSVAFSLNGEWFAAGCEDTKVYLWKSLDSKLKSPFSPLVLDAHNKDVRSVSFSADSLWLASGSEDATICLWCLENSENIQNNIKNLSLYGHNGAVHSISFSFNNVWLASGSEDKTVRLWSLEDLKNIQNNPKNQVLKIHDGAVRSVSFSHNNLWLASGSKDKTVYLSSLDNPEQLQNHPKNQILKGHNRCVYDVNFSPDDKWLISGSEDTTVRIWSLDNPSSINSENQVIVDHTDYVRCVTFNHDGQWLVSAGDDGTIRLRNLLNFNNRQNLSESGHTEQICTVAFNYDNSLLMSGSMDQTLCAWNLVNDSSCNKILINQNKKHIRSKTRSDMRSIAISRDGRLVAHGNGDKSVGLLEWREGSLMSLANFDGHSDAINVVAFSQNGQWLASGSEDRTIGLWKRNHFDPEQFNFNMNLRYHQGPVCSVAFSENNKWLASAGRGPENKDGTLCLWDLENIPVDVALLQPKVLVGHTHTVRCVTFSMDNQWLASGSGPRDKSIRLWSLSTPESIQNSNHQTLKGHDDFIWSIDFSRDSKWLLSGSNDGFIMAWQKSYTDEWSLKFKILTNFSVRSVSCGPITSNSLFFATGGSDYSVRLWEKSIDKIALSWTSCQTVLTASEANIENAQLSTANAELLKQRGANGQPNEQNDKISSLEFLKPNYYEKLIGEINMGKEYNEQIIYMIAEAKEAFASEQNVTQIYENVYLFEKEINGETYKVFGLNKNRQYDLNFDGLRAALLRQLSLPDNSAVMEVIGDSSKFDHSGSQFVKKHFATEMEHFNGLLLYGYNGKEDPESGLLDTNGVVNNYVDAHPEFANRVIANIVDYHSRIALGHAGQPVPTLPERKGWGASVSQYVHNFLLVWDNCKNGAEFGDDTFVSDRLVNSKAILYGGGVQSFEQATNVLNCGYQVTSVAGLRGKDNSQNFVRGNGYDREVFFFEAALFFNKIKELNSLQEIVAFKNSSLLEEENPSASDNRALLYFDPFKLEVNQRRKELWVRGWENFIRYETWKKISSGCLYAIDSTRAELTQPARLYFAQQYQQSSHYLPLQQLSEEESRELQQNEKLQFTAPKPKFY